MFVTSVIRLSPVSALAVAALAALLAAALVIWTALARTESDLPPDARLLSAGGIEIGAGDLIEEPDTLPSWGERAAFFARQDRLFEALRTPGTDLRYETASGEVATAPNAPVARMASHLPAAFWFQIGVGIFAVLIGAWVLALRPRDWGARMFAATGLFVPVFAWSAAIYSTRPIAMDGTIFRWLSSINHVGAMSFGIALVGLFMMYPRPLWHPRWLLVPLLAYGALIVADMLWLAPALWSSLAVLSQMIGAIVLGVLQWIRSRGEPLDRAGLRWFLVATLVGCSLFVFLSVAPPALGLTDKSLISQGYAFGFFSIMHVGLALGLLRYRLFDLDRYAWLVWLWLGGALSVFALDLLLIGWLGARSDVSLALSLILAGLVWFPLRQFLLHRTLVRRPGLDASADYMPAILEIALAPDETRRHSRYDALLAELYGASPVEPDGATRPEPRLVQSGLALELPGPAGLPPRRLAYAAGGRRVFAPSDIATWRQLVRLLDLATQSRRAFETGVRTERDRISRDVHDNIGAQILSALHAADEERKDDLLRDTLADLRTIINEGFDSTFDLGELLAEMRLETAERLAPHGIALDWPTSALGEGARIGFMRAVTLRAVLREAVSNVIKHSGATAMRVHPVGGADALSLLIADDGHGFAGAMAPDGHGLRNMRARLEAGGGAFDLSTGSEGTEILAKLGPGLADRAAA
ncbi:hypothetical protein RM543_10710 [Roseicyclus sp. F158]|uniref:Histidine kinase n=1 Tax=Tropicimonas omnivorans TaxID=3075590 RepID=A0ABU3DHX0_9RHOB|nr:hypothetical protein [Roseicyclus sp. F158]MDT0683158.1 hypothetical protein [Roseicyclus sp. F158]